MTPEEQEELAIKLRDTGIAKSRISNTNFKKGDILRVSGIDTFATDRPTIRFESSPYDWYIGHNREKDPNFELPSEKEILMTKLK